MKARTYFLIGIILIVIFSIFVALSIINSRRIMMDLIKEEARSFLSVIASTQENLIFAEGRLEDEIVDKLISICNYLEADRIDRNILNGLREHFDLGSIVILNTDTGKEIIKSGVPVEISDNILKKKELISLEYFDFGNKKQLRFAYRIADKIYQIELPYEEIQIFRQEFGINKIINQIAANPMVKYLVLQDQKGIIFATPNIQTISRIDDDSTLIAVVNERTEVSRVERFMGEKSLELIRPFIVEEEFIGIFRIGISLESYYRHVRKTEEQLIILFIILFGAGFVVFLLFIRHQSYTSIKELFHKTLGAIEDGVLMVNDKKIITGVNKMFCIMSAFDDNALTGRDYDSLFHEDPFDIKKILADGKKIADEKNIFNKDIQYTSYPLLNEKKRISGVISILHDVSKIREFEKEREEAERLVFLGNLVANFAHEIKNPMNGLSIAIQRLVKEFPTQDKDYVRITNIIKKEIDSLNKIVNDFLSLARPKIKERTEFDISEILKETLELVGEQVQASNIKLIQKIEKNIKICGNSEDFKRAVLNILLNATDAVTEVSDRERRLEVELGLRKKEIFLTILDNGIGMDEEEKNRIFSPYFTTKKRGTGLGLYIAQKIITDHQGKIKIKTKKNQGTTFEITFHQ